MTNKDWKPEGQPLEDIDPLSATGMFLSALVKESNPSQVQSDELLAQPPVRLETKPAWSAEQASTPPTPTSLANPENRGSAPGEFTRMFQSEQPSRATPPKPPEVQSIPLPVEPNPIPTFAPGEFTQVFLKPAEAASGDPLPQPARSFADQPPPAHPAPGPPRMKGFSSGASDSASTEGGFTQFFQPRASSAASSPVSRIQPPPQPPPTPAPAPAEIKWQRQSEISPVEAPVDPGASATSATGLIASMGIGGQRKEQVRQEVRPGSVDSLPSFTPKPPDAPSAVESASVTKLIQRLSEGVRPVPPAEPRTAAEIPIPTTDTGPGEFTKIITASGFRGATSVPVAPIAAAPPAAPAIAIPAAPPPLKPPVPAAAIPPAHKPVAPPPVAFQAPKVELPPAPVPKPAPPAVAAPAGKFQEIVPILLVVNTFLLLVLIVLVIFALKAK